MAKPPDPNLPPDAKLTRLQAQRQLGLWAPNDIVVGIVILLSLFALVVWWIVGDLTALQCLCVLMFDVLLALCQVVILIYRVLIFILDMHASVETLPPAAARIAAAFLQGKPADKS